MRKMQYIKITVGAMLMAIAVVSYFGELDIVTGGVTGLSIILKHTLGMPMWLVNGLFNFPLFVGAYRLFSKRMFCKTLFATILLTVFLGVVPVLDILTGDYFVDVLTGAAFMGMGIGLIFSANASSGGVDLVATMLNRRLSYLSIPKLMAVIDGAIIIFGVGVFGLNKAVYAIIAVFVTTSISDYILAGPNRAKLLYIISDKYEEIASYITHDIERGASYIKLVGAYTGENRNMIMCVVSAREMVKIKEKAYKIDDKAMCFIGDIREALGEGFTKNIG